MSKKRQLDTAMWHDPWFMDLSPAEQHLFIYLLTNDHTTIGGVYEIGMRTMVFETQTHPTVITQMLEKMKPKVHYIDGWIVMQNGIKNQNYRNSKIKTGIEMVLKECPDKLLSYINVPKDFDISVKNLLNNQTQLPVNLTEVNDETSMSHDESLHSNSNSNSNSNSKPAPDKPSLPSGRFEKTIKTPAQRRQYAIAMERERESKKKIDTILQQPRASSKTVSTIRETLAAKGIVKHKLKGTA